MVIKKNIDSRAAVLLLSFSVLFFIYSLTSLAWKSWKSWPSTATCDVSSGSCGYAGCYFDVGTPETCTCGDGYTASCISNGGWCRTGDGFLVSCGGGGGCTCIPDSDSSGTCEDVEDPCYGENRCCGGYDPGDPGDSGDPEDPGDPALAAICDGQWRDIPYVLNVASQPVGIYSKSSSSWIGIWEIVGVAAQGVDNGIYWNRCVYDGSPSLCRWDGWKNIPGATYNSPYTFTETVVYTPFWNIDVKGTDNRRYRASSTNGGAIFSGFSLSPDQSEASYGTPTSVNDWHGSNWLLRRSMAGTAQYRCGTPRDDAECVGFASVPDEVSAGETFRGSVIMRNTGSSVWTYYNNGVSYNMFQLGSFGHDGEWGMSSGRIKADHYEIYPGENATFTHDFVAPSAPRDYTFEWSIVHESNMPGEPSQWFHWPHVSGNKALCSKPIRVTGPLPDLTASAPTPNTALAGVAQIFTAKVSNLNKIVGTGTGFKNFFQVASDFGGKGTITDLPASDMAALSPGGEANATVSHSFASSGAYSIRLCADKTSSAGGGVINEANDDNNCGSWTDVVVVYNNVPPQGHFDVANCSSLDGWAYDPNNPSVSINVEVKEGGTSLGVFAANSPRPDVNQVVGIPGDHGFVIPTPASLKDGGIHNVSVYALDSEGGSSALLGSKSVGCSVGLSASPTTIPSGGESTLSWSYSGVSSCSATSPINPAGYPNGSGSVSTGALTVSKTYSLTCDGIARQATVNVQAQPKMLNLIKTGQGRVRSVPGGIDCGTGCSEQSVEFPADSSVTLTATPAQNRIFTGWGGDCSGSAGSREADGSEGSCTLIMNGDKTVIANFAVDPSVIKEF